MSAQVLDVRDDLFDEFIQWPADSPRLDSVNDELDDGGTSSSNNQHLRLAAGTSTPSLSIAAASGKSAAGTYGFPDEGIELLSSIHQKRHRSASFTEEHSGDNANTMGSDVPNPVYAGLLSISTQWFGREQPHPPLKLRRLMSKPSERSAPNVKGTDIGEGFVNTIILPGGNVSAPQLKKVRRMFDRNEKLNHRAVLEQGGSCTLCWIMQHKCDPGTCCGQCAKRQIPGELCCRTRVIDLRTYKESSLASTFIEAYSSSIAMWYKTPVAVKVWHGFGPKLEFQVDCYKPQRDIIDLFWKEPTGWQKLAHTPYGLRMTDSIGADNLDKYAFNQIPGILRQLRDANFKARDTFLSTMSTAVRYLHNEASLLEDRQLLKHALTFWSYTFLQYHGLWHIVDTDDTTGKLGMTRLVLDTHDAQTFTMFNGTIPLPRLLHQQIHSCVDGRLRNLDRIVLKGLQQQFKIFKSTRERLTKTALAEHGLGLYLTTWVYMSVLEEVEWDAHRWILRLPRFEWPLAETPFTTIDRIRQAAEVMAANYEIALDNQNIWQLNAMRSKKKHASSEKAMENSQGLAPQSTELKLDAHELEVRKAAEFEASDIRSLEMKFSAMLMT